EVTDERRTFITSHAAYTYLADRYDLHQVGISGIDPETEPSPQRLLALEAVVRDEEVTTIFFEATASPKVAQTLADNLGIDSAELDN
ncbi:metal ABC transporter substrate-binding protein, partial [Staphylococcus aureus]|nr:metal ABC transporter substrate-binding protein [Staphylococcus aureus]